MIKLDKINRQILSILQKNSSITNSKLAKTIGLAPATTLERIKKLEVSGVIRGYVALVDQKKIGKPITAFVEISVTNHSDTAIKEFSKEITAKPEVLECYHVAGVKDFLLKVVTEDIETYREFALDTIKDSTGIPVE